MGRSDAIAAQLTLPPEDLAFSEELIAGEPEPVQRYFRNAIAEGTPLARSVTLRQTGSMKPNPAAARFEIAAEETLAPPFGLVWNARTTIGPLPFRIVDTHFEGKGALRGSVLGIPVMRGSGIDMSRSSRHRVVAESIWVPSALLPHRGVAWTAESDRAIRASIVIDEESVDIRLTLNPDGAVGEVSMHRYGNVGTPDWSLIPYGFATESESTFEGYTIPSTVRGGWWYGTDRYQPEAASFFSIHGARFR